jgi:hypothetical protein
MKKMLPTASMFEIHGYGRSLIAQKKTEGALEIFKMNFEKNPNQMTTLVGWCVDIQPMEIIKQPWNMLTKAMAVTDAQNKTNIQTMIDKLKAGKDVN